MIFITQLFQCFIYYMDIFLYADVEISRNRSKILKQIHLLGTFIHLAAKTLQIWDCSPILESLVSTSTSVTYALARPTSLWSPNKTCPLKSFSSCFPSWSPSSPPTSMLSCQLHVYHQEALPHLPTQSSLFPAFPHGTQCHTFLRAQNPISPVTIYSCLPVRLEIITSLCQDLA